MVRKILSLMMIGGLLSVAACNTVRGVGEDISSAANTTEDAIN